MHGSMRRRLVRRQPQTTRQAVPISYPDADGPPNHLRSLMSNLRVYGLSLAGVLVAAVVFAGWLWLKTPPGAVRLLPECDAIVYVNVKPLRAATHFDLAPVARVPEYQGFVDATGIVPERDLDAVALAMHRMDDPRGPNGAVAYSEVFEGRFDRLRLVRYLTVLAAARESYKGQTIFTVPVGDTSGRRLRVAVLDGGLVVASNAPATEQIHAMLDRSRSGPSLLTRYKEVPWLAPAWGIGRLGLPLAEDGFISVGGLRLPLREDAEFVASLRYSGAVKLRVEEFSPTALDAERTARELTSLLTLLRAVVENQQGTQAEPVREVLDSAHLAVESHRVVLTGSIPLEALRPLAASSNSQATPAPR